jgi:4-amino-4-deoxy-L-arabinose transferase-like glycosyltransferase
MRPANARSPMPASFSRSAAPDRFSGLSIGLLYRLLLVAHLGLCVLFALLAPFPAGFDEQAHFSYIAHILERHEVTPSFDEMFLVEADDPSAWGTERNYLNHPAFYYVALAALAQSLGGVLPNSWLLMRLANACLSTAALALALRIGLRAGWPASAQAAFGMMLVTVPTLPILGGLVTNDNLAWFGGALCCLGAFELLRDGFSAGRAAMLTGGFALASLAKLTAALLCGGLVVGVMVVLAARDGWLLLVGWRLWLVLGLGALALVPYLWLWAQYGSPAPYTLGQAAVLESRLAEIPQWREQRFGLPRYAAHFLLSLLLFWPALVPRSGAAVLLLAAPLMCLCAMAAGIALALRALARRRPDAAELFVLCGVLALAATMAIHLGFTFERHLETGWLKGVYPRYYFPLLPVLPAAGAILAARLRSPTMAALLMVLSLGYAGIGGLEVVRFLS